MNEVSQFDLKRIQLLRKYKRLPYHPLYPFNVSYQIQIKSEFLKSLSLILPNPIITPYTNGMNDFDIDIYGNLVLACGSSPSNMTLYDIRYLECHKNQYIPKECIIQKKTIPNVNQLQWYQHDSGMFIVSSVNEGIFLWDTEKFCDVLNFGVKSRINTFQMSSIAASHSIVALGLQNKLIQLIDLRTSNNLLELKGHMSSVQSVCWSRNKEIMLLSGDAIGNILIWDIRRADKPITSLNHYSNSFMNDVISKYQSSLAHESAVISMCTLRRYNYLVSLSIDNNIKIWNLSTMKRVSTILNDTPYDYCTSKKYTIASTAVLPTTYLINDVIFVPGGKLPQTYCIETGLHKNIFQDSIFSNAKTHIIRLHPYRQLIFTGDQSKNLNVWKPTSPWNEKNTKNTLYQDSWSDSDNELSI